MFKSEEKLKEDNSTPADDEKVEDEVQNNLLKWVNENYIGKASNKSSSYF